MPDFRLLGLGWYPDVPDIRDYTHDHAKVQQLLQPLARLERPNVWPTSVDLQEYFLPARDQGNLRCSSAHACVGLLEYFQRRVHGDNTPLAVRFTYNTTLRLKRQCGDCGADLRSTLKSLTRFGAPPEDLWPYSAGAVTDKPDAFLFRCAERATGFVYYRIANPTTSGDALLKILKSYLLAEIPLVFAFGVPDSTWNSSCIDFRPYTASVLGGQAVVAVGYDDDYDGPTRGAVLFRSSWGCEWGEAGCGWLPYEFVRQNLAQDFWAILRDDWVQSETIFHPFEFLCSNKTN